MSTNASPEIKTFGPFRTIGLSYRAGNGNYDFPGVWHRLMDQIEGKYPTEGVNYFGMCRCISGATDGTWEYIAAIEVPAGTAAPQGMVSVDVPSCEYATFPIEGLSAVGAAWSSAPKTVQAMVDYDPYCGPKGCECATHPCFELYPPTYPKDGRLSLYLPIRRK